jgi:hypothetical protein
MKKFDEILKEIPLEARIEAHLMFEDDDNWMNGEYKGDRKALRTKAESLGEICRIWIADGMPMEAPKNDISL